MISKYLLFFTLPALICYTNNANTVASSALLAAVQNLPYLIIPHAEPAEIKARIMTELIVNGYLAEADESSLTRPQEDSKTITQMLAQRGYQIQNKTLVNRFTAHKERYTKLFQEFLSSTNQKEKSVAAIKRALGDLKKEHPHILLPPVRMYDIGCGNGHFSTEVVKVLSSYMPRGAQNIHFSGIDRQKDFVESTNTLVHALNVASSTVKQGDFKEDDLETLPKDAATFIVASHVCYGFSNMDEFMIRARRIARPNTPIIFLHTADSPIDIYRKKFMHLLHPSVQHGNNTANNITESLKKSSTPYVESTVKSYVQFLAIPDATWELLKNVHYAHFDADYSAYGSDFIRTKHLLEFYLIDALEAFTTTHRALLLEEFKKILVEHNYRIPIASVMHVAILNSK